MNTEPPFPDDEDFDDEDYRDDMSESEAGRCPDVDVIVVDEKIAHFASAVDDWNSTTLLACVSEDPVDWADIAAVWPRYKTEPSAEFADSLDFQIVDAKSALAKLSNERAWMVIDLRDKRICTGTANDPVERNGCYAMGDNNGFGPEFRIPVHLPPWWELHCQVDLPMVRKPRLSEVPRFSPHRDVLWGPELSKGLAQQMLATYESDARLREVLIDLSVDFSSPEIPIHAELPDNKDIEVAQKRRVKRNELYERTIAVHRDWLMTPRQDLAGRMPRQCLHGGMDWLDRVIEGQKYQISRSAASIPIPREMAERPETPMGRSEVCMYFDLCRELINEGWVWISLQSEKHLHEADALQQLALHLSDVQKNWMNHPFEGGSSPSAIIQAERCRSPRVLGEDGEQPLIDCDCPICQMMIGETFGETFVSIDGHHLELDDEFAFSLCETREEWDEQQREYEEFSRAMDLKRIEREEANSEEQDEFGSVWKHTFVSDQGIPGDTNGHLSISFFLADMISTLKEAGAKQEDIDAINQVFRQYREAGPYELAAATDLFQQTLEHTAQTYPLLVGRSADLQHRLDELFRGRTSAHFDDDCPF
ncbi:MAG: hypothetical protein ABL921_10640 [Pirellula sp.]